MPEPRPHPRNTNFAWPIRTGPFRLLNEAQANQWNEQGYLLLEGVFEQEMLSKLQSEIDPFELKMETYLRDQHQGAVGISRADEITFTIHLAKKSASCRAFTQHKVFADLCHDLVGDNVRLYWDQAVYKKPETPREFPWHQDNGYNYVEPQDYLTCWVPLNDATIENGCPWVVPGVHLQGTLDHWATDLGYRCIENDASAVPVEAGPGDIVVFSSLTPHRTGPNLTSDVRKAYIIQYAHDGAKMFPRDYEQELFQDDPDRQYFVVKDGKPVGTST